MRFYASLSRFTLHGVALHCTILNTAPANITVNDGLVIYELVDFEYIKNETVWNRNSLVKGLRVRNSDYVQGVILLQLIQDRKLKVEILTGKNANEVDSFSEKAVIYER